MSLDHRLVQTQSQQQILSPQLKQYLKLLALPLLELRHSVEQELTQNPVLEIVEPEVDASSIEGESSSPEDDFSPGDRELLDTLDKIGFNESQSHGSSEMTDEIQQKRGYQESLITKQTTLADYLTWQMGLLKLNDNDRLIAQEIIGSINEDGYLETSIEDIASKLNTPASRIEKLLLTIQTFDPPGVGGRNLSEVLLLQLHRYSANDVAHKIAEHHMNLLERKQFDQIAKALAVPTAKVIEAYDIISRLEPKPGRIFYHDSSMAVIPDISISRDDDDSSVFTIDIQDEHLPTIRINREYRKMLKQKNLDAKTKAFLREKVQSALIFLRALGERKSTLRRIAETLVKVQKDFLLQGFSQLKPLRLKDVADELGIHESTISRAIQGKYVSSPQGTISLKSFFSSGMQAADGTMESQKSVMEMVKNLIEKEDQKKPLTDSQIVDLLKAEGIPIARRTVAKYRDLLKILPTHLRKNRNT